MIRQLACLAIGLGVWVSALGGASRGAAVGFDQPTTPVAPVPAGEDVPMTIKVESSAFAPGATIPARHTGDGEDLSPPLKWSQAPEAAKEFALIMDDPDAPTDEPWVHWVLYNLPVSVLELPENVTKTEKPGQPAGCVQGKNSFGKVGYGGPAPPRGHGLHHYHFKVYALREPIEAPGGLTKRELLDRMKGRVVAQGELVGTYERKK